MEHAISIRFKGYTEDKLSMKYSWCSAIDFFYSAINGFNGIFYKNSSLHILNNILYKQKYSRIKPINENLNLDKIIKKCKELEKMNINLCIIGLGGLTWNFLEYLLQVYNYCIEKGKIKAKLFNKMYIYENDILEWHNVPRLPIPYYKHNIKKIEYAKKYKTLCKKLILRDKYFNENVLIQFKNKKDNIVFFGAFDIKTRQLFSKHNEYKAVYCGFIKNNFYIFNEFKTINEDIIGRETYGRLDIYSFLEKLRTYLHIVIKSIIKTYNNEKIDIQF